MSIELVDITKSYKIKRKRHVVFDGLNLSIPAERNVGIMGRNGAGKSTLLRMIAGAELPDSGKIIRKMSISWPLGFQGFFQNSISGAANVRFCARIHGVDPLEIIGFVEEFSELGEYMSAPVKTYSTGMRARLGFGLSMAIKFDCLLIDEVLAVGDAKFRKKCQIALDERRQNSSLILVSHSKDQIVRNCDTVVILGFGEPIVSTDVEQAVEDFQQRLTQ